MYNTQDENTDGKEIQDKNLTAVVKEKRERERERERARARRRIGDSNEGGVCKAHCLPRIVGRAFVNTTWITRPVCLSDVGVFGRLSQLFKERIKAVSEGTLG